MFHEPNGILWYDLKVSNILIMPEAEGQKSPVDEMVQKDTEDLEAGDTTYNWRRGVFFNATIVGLAAFAAPGLWNAMQSVGAGGQQTPYLVM